MAIQASDCVDYLDGVLTRCGDVVSYNDSPSPLVDHAWFLGAAIALLALVWAVAHQHRIIAFVVALLVVLGFLLN